MVVSKSSSLERKYPYSVPFEPPSRREIIAMLARSKPTSRKTSRATQIIACLRSSVLTRKSIPLVVESAVALRTLYPCPSPPANFFIVVQYRRRDCSGESACRGTGQRDEEVRRTRGAFWGASLCRRGSTGRGFAWMQCTRAWAGPVCTFRTRMGATGRLPLSRSREPGAATDMSAEATV